MPAFIAVATWIARAVYAVFKGVLPVRHKVVFLSRQSNTPSRDFTMLAESLRLRDPELEIVMRCRMVGRAASERIAAILPTLGQMYHLATSTVCVVDGYVIPVSLLDHRPQLFVVQLWHALGAIKRFGYQTLDRPGGHPSALATAMRMHRNYDAVLCAGPATVPFFAEAFGVDPSAVLPLGLPRMDYLAAHSGGTKASEAMRSRFPILADPDRFVVLYAPTLRRGGADRYQDVTGRFSGAGYTLIVKPHPLQTAHVGGENVVDAAGADILDVLPLCNAVITDYSAVAFEASVLDLPVLFWVHDIDQYEKTHGLNIDPLEELPGISSRSLDGIATMIDSRDFDPAAARVLKERYVSAQPGTCTERIADVIISRLASA